MSGKKEVVTGTGAPHWSETYELVVGLEVHAQLITESKAYSSDPNAYGDHPNTNVSVITLGHPGTLPVANKKVVELAVRMGLATNCTIADRMHYARKNYFYPDLPKGYQITQDKTPICTNGFVDIPDTRDHPRSSSPKTATMEAGMTRIGITRIHMEEDAGKSIHDVDPFNTLVDLNRAGVPLIEIVSEPDIRSAQEAYDYLVEIRRLVRYLDICDGNMEEGSLRCDANISLRPIGSGTFGTRCEVKNMNSFRNVMRAIEYEAQRQSEILAAGGTISMETRTFDAGKGSTIGMRSKELAHDYRYFPEPDLQPLTVSAAVQEAIRKEMPPLPRELRAKYTGTYGLSDYDAAILTDDKATALYYEGVIAHTGNYKAAANWVMGDVRSWVNERGLTMAEFPISAERLSGLVQLIDTGKVSHTIASQKLFPMMLEEVTSSAADLATKHDLLQSTDEGLIESIMHQVMATYPDKVEAYRKGNKGLLGLFMGEVMKGTKGKADPKRTNEVVRNLLEKANA
ncbi:MAG: Asp-tRNA(Asn)/Glu-tRNA(Gln) amidotransferase subunit GatB [Flavobacteriales bacterium]|nr:Asp-tRNA(Asn)/Glu-tRNA(Gln) amidotransferase subunit GatB [Flavobacteriales bacterium]HRH68248.1 Asp-tRNA(Asn)/Glu-tRNA(Gln) amidotransferase subunit GatB [Flavobacteriales bacterium]